NNSPLPQKRKNRVSDGYAIPKHGCSLHPTPEEVGFTAQRIKSYCDKQAEKERIESKKRTYIPPGKNGESARIRFFELSADSKYDGVRREYAGMPEGQYALHSHPSDLTKVYLVKKNKVASNLMYCEIPRTALQDVLQGLGTNIRALFIPPKQKS
ncbi:MAG: hypothetical protein JSR97_01940, partial [Verrucomicrobia bacterium]|nr:hypothetical protein [Verrucomicrobiota bacterium]